MNLTSENNSIITLYAVWIEKDAHSISYWNINFTGETIDNSENPTIYLESQKFSKQLLKENIPARNYIIEFADWEKAIHAILDLPYGNKKKLLVIDEFPYMCKGNRSIPSILQNLWDAELRNANVMIILCGSAMSFIEKELLAEKNPLYGRATGIYKMKEMGFSSALLRVQPCGLHNPAYPAERTCSSYSFLHPAG